MNFNLKLLLIPIVLFIIGANYAWLNPYPENKVYKTTDIPFFWQFNPDAGVEIVSGAYFPEAYKMYKDRINRPTYPILVNSLGKVAKFVLKPFKNLSQLESAGAGYILLKILIFLLGAFICFNVLNNFLNEQLSLFGGFLIFFSSFSIDSFATFHTYELQFISPIIFIFLLLKLKSSYSIYKNILFSIIVGILLLGRENYAIYLSILIYCGLNKQYLKVLISFISHLIPLGIYLIYLKIINIEYYNHEVTGYNQGNFLINLILDANYKELFLVTINSIYYFFKSIVIIFNVLLFIIIYNFKKLKKHRNLLIFSIIAGTLTYLQFLAVRNFSYSYLISDLTIFVVVLSFIELKKISKTKIVLITSLYLIVNILTLANFPLKSPHNFEFRNQKVLNQRKDMINNFDEYSDEDREKAKNGNLIQN